jgi:hypothetical protein
MYKFITHAYIVYRWFLDQKHLGITEPENGELIKYVHYITSVMILLLENKGDRTKEKGKKREKK